MGFPKTGLILAAGFGTRMGSLGKDCPKPLLKVANKTLLEWQVINMSNAGITSIGVNVHHFPDLMFAEIDRLQKSYPTLKFFISHEKEKILGQGGGLVNLIRHAQDDFFLSCNCDSFLKLTREEFNTTQITLKVMPADGSNPTLNRICFENDGFSIEKPSSMKPGYYYTGFMIFHRDHLKGLPPDHVYQVVEHMWRPHQATVAPSPIRTTWLDIGEEDKFLAQSNALPPLILGK